MSSYSSEESQKEASRCLYCDELCNVCSTTCPNLANFSYRVDPVLFYLKKALHNEDGSITFEKDCEFRAEQPWQILNIRDLCNECGNCTTFCPTSGRPFADKPGLSLSIESFNREGEGYFLSRLPGRDILIFKDKGGTKTLELREDTYIYETDQVEAILDQKTFNPIKVKILTPCVKEVHFSFAASMSMILKGAIQIQI